jgi:hypothetical protein
MSILHLLLLSIAAAPVAAPGDLNLAVDGRTGYTIVVPPRATPADHFAVAELRAFLRQSTGVEFPLGHYDYTARRIFVGLGEGTRPALGRDPLAGFADEEHAVKTRGRDVYLYGKGQFGNLWAVYDFLENEVGCRFYSSFAPPAVPEHKRLALGPIDRRTRLALPVRAVHNNHFRGRPDAGGLLFLLRNKVNWDLLGDYPGGLKQANINPGSEALPLIGAWVHTVFYYIPPVPTPRPANGPYQEWLHGRGYFDAHPEFFSMNARGQRVRDRQLCFSNAALRRELTANIERTIREDGRGRGVVALEAADTPGEFCACPECKKLEQKYQAPGGPLFDYVIELAAQLKADYPQIYVKTLVYRRAQTQLPPTGVRFPDNVIAIFAPVEDNFAADWTETTAWTDYHDGQPRQNSETYEHLKRWCQIAKNVWVWYYPNTYNPYAVVGSVDRLVGDIRLMHKAGVSGAWFEHDVNVNCDFGFTDLQSYLMVKLIQKPDLDAEKLIGEFLRLKYGRAAPLMARYLREVEAATRAARPLVGCGSYASLTARMTSADDALRWQRMFDEAERCVADDPARQTYLARTRVYLDCTTLFNWRSYAEKHPQYFREVRSVADRARQAAAGRKEPTTLIDVLTLTAGGPRNPLPEPLAAIAPERIVQVLPDRGTSTSRDKVKDPQAAFGMATETLHETPFQFGFYDFGTKWHGPRKSLEGKDIIPDRYQLHHLGEVRLTPRSLVWLSAHSWEVGYSGELLYRPGTDNQWDVYISLKFEGPLYPGSQAAKNCVLCDRIVFVKAK